MKARITLYPFGKEMTTEVEDTTLEAVMSSIKGWLSLHHEGSIVDIDLRFTL